MLILSTICGIIIALVLLVLLDEKTSVKVPFLHKSKVSVLIKAAYKSDLVVTTIRHLKKIKAFVISNVCRLAK